jgi:V8-like Glu-specific endopeptidase
MSDVSHLRRLIATRSRAASAGLAPEAMTETALTSEAPKPDDVMQRVRDVMDKMPPEEITNPDDFQRALAIFEQHAHRTLRKLDRDPAAPLDRGEENALEAVVRTDGTRPTLLVRGDTINPDHPLAGTWRDTLFGVRDTMRARAAAIGRLEPANGSASRFFGTGWLVDGAKGLVLTNLHVLHAMLAAVPNAMIRSGAGFRVLAGAVFIDFAAEDGSLVKKRFRVVEVTPSGIDGPGFQRLDAAVARIEPLDGAAALPMPKPIPVIADLSGPTGAMSSFCVIGFPGRPEVMSGIVDGVNWDWVTQTLFGNRFGVKRIAPGIAHKPLGDIAGDERQWIFGHDATTLGGSSGSPVLAWRDAGFNGFGLHFAGATQDRNFAHALAQCREQLQALGVPVKDPD